MAIGAYAATLLTLERRRARSRSRSPPRALLPALVAVPLGLPVLRLRGVFLAIATIGFGEVVRLGLVNWDYVNGAQGIVAIPQKTSLWMIYLVARRSRSSCLARLRGSKWGFALEAIREDEPAARTHGDPHHRATSSPCSSSAPPSPGSPARLEAHFTFMVAPNGFAFGRVVDMLVFAVVGGDGARSTGPVVGAAFLTLLPELLREVAPLVGIEPGPAAPPRERARPPRRHPVPAERHRLPARAAARSGARARSAAA